MTGEVKANEVKITFDLDDWTWGDLEDIDDFTNVRRVRLVIQRHARSEQIEAEQMGDHLRGLSVDEMLALRRALIAAVNERSNPRDGTGKN